MASQEWETNRASDKSAKADETHEAWLESAFGSPTTKDAGDLKKCRERSGSPESPGVGTGKPEENKTLVFEPAIVEPKQASPESAGKKVDGAGKPLDLLPANYSGEPIKRDLTPSEHLVETGDTLGAIAAENLGKDAGKDEIARHIKEIAAYNHISNPDQINPGDFLFLPGHTSDGGFVTLDDSGNKYSRFADGRLKIDYASGASCQQVRLPDGGYLETHKGARADDNYRLKRSPDGHYQIAEGDSQSFKAAKDDPRIARAHFRDVIESQIKSPGELSAVHSDIYKFDERSAKRPLAPAEVARTYDELTRFVEHKGKSHVDRAERLRLSEQILNQAAAPTEISQGDHSTCNVTAVESRVYTRNPSEAARLVADVAISGKFTTRDGKVIHPPAGSLKPDAEAVTNPTEDGDRTYASQLFQVTAVNMYYQTNGHSWEGDDKVKHKVGPGQMRYEQHKPEAGQTPPDTGERLYDLTKHPPEKVDTAPGLNDDEIVKINNMLTGETGVGCLIEHQEFVVGDPEGVTTIGSEKDLNEQLARAAKENRLPIILGVDSGNEPLLRDSGNGIAGGSGGPHVLTVVAYHEGPPARAEIANQWGSESNHLGNKALTVHDLFMTMRAPDDPGQIGDYEKDVQHNREKHTVDAEKEFEYLRLRRKLDEKDPKHIDDGTFNEMMHEQIDAAGKRWQQQEKDKNLNPEEYKRGREKLHDMTFNEAEWPDLRLDWLQHAHQSHVLSDKEYHRALSHAIFETKELWKKEDEECTADKENRRMTIKVLRDLLLALPQNVRKQVVIESRPSIASNVHHWGDGGEKL